MSICSVGNCNSKTYGFSEYCNKHYQQFKRFGKIRSRTIHDPNEFIINGDICWVVLYNRECLEIARAKFYAKYYETIKDYKWHLRNNGYVESNYIDSEKHWQKMTLHGAIIYLSEQIIEDDQEIDHKDGNKLNCLDDNLRICTHAENMKNVKKYKTNSSGYIGVSWDKSAKKWRAHIRNKGRLEHLGNFDSKEDAARAYNAAAIKYRGEFAVLNIIPEGL